MNELIKYHWSNPNYFNWLNDYDSIYRWDDISCWNVLICSVKIENDILKNIWFIWDVSMLVKAWASIVWWEVIWENINDIIKLKYETLRRFAWYNESKTRKKQSFWLWLLCVINAIKKYKWEKEIYISDIM